MSSDTRDPHDVEDGYDNYGVPATLEELEEQFALAYSLTVPDDTPRTPPPPEPEEQQPVKHQVDYLQLPGLRTLSEPIVGKTRLTVRVEQLMPPACPECGSGAEQFKGNGTRRQFLLDEPRGSMSVRLDLRRRSYSCRVCKKSRLVPLDCLAEGRRMTRRLELYIRRKSLLRPFLEVAQETGVSPKTVREIFREHTDALELGRKEKFPTPRVLGLDGVYINSKERLILTDPVRGLIIDMWPKVRAESVAPALRGLPDRERVEVVTIDMSLGLRQAVRQALPDAAIVIDRYHIQRMANEAVDRVRHRLRKEIKDNRGGIPMCHRKLLRKHRGQLDSDDLEAMERYFRLLPELRSAYETKEGFFAIWGAADSAGARARYEAWRGSCPPDVLAEFKPLHATMKKWGEYIFNYFDHRYTNAFTEASNRRIKDIQREGRGCDYKTVRAKIIYGTLLRQELKAAREAEPGTTKRRGTPRAKGPRPRAAEAEAFAASRRPLPVGLQLSLF
jgi:transposase